MYIPASRLQTGRVASRSRGGMGSRGVSRTAHSGRKFAYCPIEPLQLGKLIVYCLKVK